MWPSKLKRRTRTKTFSSLNTVSSTASRVRETNLVLSYLHIGLKHVCSAYDFVVNPEQNLIVMDLLGKFG